MILPKEDRYYATKTSMTEQIVHLLGGRVDLFFDLRQMGDFTLDVAWEELKFSRSHAHNFNRIAVITDSQWVTWTAWLSQIFLNADVRVFDDADDAEAWLAGSESPVA